ncbi:MAG: hypothetical protein WCS77_07970, partial [Elusimicrobiaceae bacterium]
MLPESKNDKRLVSVLLPYLTGGVVAVMLLALKFRFLDKFFITTWHGRLAFDYFSVPRSFINLTHGRSIFATSDCAYGPYASWYPYHPSLSLWLGSFLSWLSPWTGYAVFVLLSVFLLFLCARVLAKFAEDRTAALAAYFILLCSPSAFLMLWCGQMHVFTVLAVTLITADLADLIFLRSPSCTWRLGKYALRPLLLGGVLVSLFSKPLLLVILPALFAVSAYRVSLLAGGAFYALVSAAFVFLPALNPQGIGFDGIVACLLNPRSMFKLSTVGDITVYQYKTELVRDSAIHWLNMKSRSAIFEPEHMELFGLPVFFSHLIGRRVGSSFYMIPMYAMLGLSAACYFIRDAAKRVACVLAVCALGVLGFYTSYSV